MRSDYTPFISRIQAKDDLPEKVPNCTFLGPDISFKNLHMKLLGRTGGGHLAYRSPGSTCRLWTLYFIPHFQRHPNRTKLSIYPNTRSWCSPVLRWFNPIECGYMIYHDMSPIHGKSLGSAAGLRVRKFQRKDHFEFIPRRQFISCRPDHEVTWPMGARHFLAGRANGSVHWTT